MSLRDLSIAMMLTAIVLGLLAAPPFDWLAAAAVGLCGGAGAVLESRY